MTSTRNPTHRVTVRYSDHAVRTLPVEAGQTILEAALAHGVPIVSECRNGVCGTCIGRCTGAYELGHCIGLSEYEKNDGRILTCQTRVQSACDLTLDYPLASNAARITSGEAVVTRIEHVSDEVVSLVLSLAGLPEPMTFRCGQYAELNVPGTPVWRSYSFAHAPRDGAEIELLVRLLPDGAMSNYLRDRAAPGDTIAIRGARGGFLLRDSTRPVVLVAGGTGLSAIMAIAEELVQGDCTRAIRLNYGVTRAEDLAFLPRLAAMASAYPGFTWRAIVATPSPAWAGAVGLVTDLLSDTDLHGGEVDIYLCGPAAMVDATRDWLHRHKIFSANLYYEKFVPSGAARAGARAGAETPAIDHDAIRRAGLGRAVVIGGSIAGMAAARILRDAFDRVEVLEKGQLHRRMEGRPDSAQGWHLHHLLIAGQRQLETIFPGIIDDMVQAGAFKVDMGEQYRIMLAGSWKKAVRSGIEIVCAGRPLLEWCIRRRLDTESAIDYRYECEVRDIVLHPGSRAVIGVVLECGGALEVVPAEFVVDASGKNTPLPALLERHGFGAPLLEEDHIHCFYSSMLHKVPPERVWRDKVMTIAYAHRPQQKYYAAQYYIDQSRTILSTSLVGYDCYDPPRNAEEFREFARRMPAPDIGDELEGLEPCSPVRNFRYPAMQRYHYEDMQSLPGGLVAVGDAYSSADPVSGAGMTKALLELNELRDLLRARTARDCEFVERYYASVSRISDLVWSVIREQNLRYPWIHDVERKRAPFFRMRNWYVDRVFEALHEDPDIYRLYLMVTHFVQPPEALMKPGVLVRVLGRWLKTRLRFRKTLLERNFATGRAPDGATAG